MGDPGARHRHLKSFLIGGVWRKPRRQPQGEAFLELFLRVLGLLRKRGQTENGATAVAEVFFTLKTGINKRRS